MSERFSVTTFGDGPTPQVLEKRGLRNTRYTIVSVGGLVLLTLWDSNADTEYKAFLSRLWVYVSERRKGHAKTLIRKAKEIAISNGYKELYLEWSESITSVEIKNWFLRLGFQVVEGDHKKCVMRLTLGC